MLIVVVSDIVPVVVVVVVAKRTNALHWVVSLSISHSVPHPDWSGSAERTARTIVAAAAAAAAARAAIVDPKIADGSGRHIGTFQVPLSTLTAHTVDLIGMFRMHCCLDIRWRSWIDRHCRWRNCNFSAVIAAKANDAKMAISIHTILFSSTISFLGV